MMWALAPEETPSKNLNEKFVKHNLFRLGYIGAWGNITKPVIDTGDLLGANSGSLVSLKIIKLDTSHIISLHEKQDALTQRTHDDLRKARSDGYHGVLYDIPREIANLVTVALDAPLNKSMNNYKEIGPSEHVDEGAKKVGEIITHLSAKQLTKTIRQIPPDVLMECAVKENLPSLPASLTRIEKMANPLDSINKISNTVKKLASDAIIKDVLKPVSSPRHGVIIRDNPYAYWDTDIPLTESEIDKVVKAVSLKSKKHKPIHAIQEFLKPLIGIKVSRVLSSITVVRDGLGAMRQFKENLKKFNEMTGNSLNFSSFIASETKVNNKHLHFVIYYFRDTENGAEILDMDDPAVTGFHEFAFGDLLTGSSPDVHIRPVYPHMRQGSSIISGIAAAYANSRSEIAKSLAGVAIAVALVPPLATTAIGLAWLDLNMTMGALLLFLTNLSG
ncbi:MAG: DUF389 domain-containing protein, partial [Gammaproteobacteria bacterium]